MPRSLTPEHEKMLWDKKELNMETSRGLSRTVIFYLIKCFAIWQGKELRHLDTSQVTFGEDDLGFYVALDLQKEKKKKKRYDDPANPRSVYKILKKYRSYVANEGPLLVRPITSIKDYICYSPLPLGVNVIERAVSLLTKDAGICPVYDNYSLNLQAVDTLIRFGTGSHCLASWLFKNGLRGMPPAPTCGPTNCEDSNPEMSLMMSRLLDAPYPFDAVDMIQKMELDVEEPKMFDSWMTNLMSKKMKDIEKQKKQTEKKENVKISDGKKQSPGVDKNERNGQSKNMNVKKLSNLRSSHCLETSQSLSSGSKEDDAFKISSISSISEGAFSMQVDEAQHVKTNTSATAKKKRKQSTNGNDQQLSLKKLRPNSLNVCDSPQTRDDITHGSTDDAIQLNKKTNECFISHEISKSLVMEVKKEIVTNGDVVVDSEVENTQSLRSVSILDNKITENDCHKVPSPSEMCCVDGESDRCLTQEASEHVSKEFTDMSDTSRCVLTSANSTVSLPKEIKQLSGAPSYDKDLTNSISVLQETFNDHYSSNRVVKKKANGADDIVVINSSFKEVMEDLFDTREIPAICGDNIENKDDSSVEDDDNEFMIDLSPPVLSPQIPISTDDNNEGIDDVDETSDEYGKGIKSHSTVRDNQCSIATPSSSSDIMRFLDNAQKQIRYLLKPTKNNTSNGESDEKDTPTSAFDNNSKNAIDKMSESEILSDTGANPCERLINDNINETTASSNESSSGLSSPSKKKCSLLRTFLEKPKESITVSSSSALSSLLVSREQILSSLPSCTFLSRAPTSLLPKAIVYNTLPDSLPLQNSASHSRSHTSNNKSDDKASRSNVECKHSHNGCPMKSNSSSLSSHLPVQIVLNKNETCSSSSSSSNLPITLVLNTAPSSSVSSTQSISCSSTAHFSSAHNTTSSSSSSSQLPSLSTSDTDFTTACGTSTAIFRAKQDLKLNTLYQTLEVGTPETEGSPERYNFADIPDSSKPLPPSCKYRGGRIQTSEINLGDYFPTGTLIPASSIRIITQQGQNGSEVVMRFGFNQNGWS